MFGRVFNIVQYEYHPDSYDANGNLKPGAVPLITEYAIVTALKHKSILQYAYIWHDKDTTVDKDGNIIVKPKHVHIVLLCPNKVDSAAIAKWFGIPENYIHFPKGRGAFLDCVEYLTHESTKEQAAGKHLYSDSEVHSNFDFRAELTKRQQRIAKYGRNDALKMSDNDVMKLHVLQDGWTMKQCRDAEPLVYASVRDHLPKLRFDYLRDQQPCPFRMNIYVDGQGGLGKGALCEYIAQKIFPDIEKPFFIIGNDSRVSFDGYDGEPVIIWDDYRAAQFIRNFGRGGTFNIFDTHPRQQAQQAKHSHVILTNSVNIVNSVEPYITFMDGLAGEYSDRDNIKHVAEDKNQAYRRFPMILHIRENDFDILFNRGFADDDTSAYQQYELFKCVRGSIMKVVTTFTGEAQEQLLSSMIKPVLECYNMLVKNHDTKINGPNLIPAEFQDYGTTISLEELAEQEDTRKIDSLFLFVDEYTQIFIPQCDNDIRKFSYQAYLYLHDNSTLLFTNMSNDEKNQIIYDVASFDQNTIAAFVLREYSENYYGDIPESFLNNA